MIFFCFQETKLLLFFSRVGALVLLFFLPNGFRGTGLVYVRAEDNFGSDPFYFLEQHF